MIIWVSKELLVKTTAHTLSSRRQGGAASSTGGAGVVMELEFLVNRGLPRRSLYPHAPAALDK